MTYDARTFANAYNPGNRYKRHIAELRAAGWYTDNIEAASDGAMQSLDEGARSFVIYGEPQSGKTAMMIALTARLLDAGYPLIVVLVNDNVQLLKQNLARFRLAKLNPAPVNFVEVLDPEVSLSHGQWIIFCKKNASDLRKLIEKLHRAPTRRVIVDDEADFATPNSKINLGKQSKINELVESMLGSDGTYIGVTATPARLNLNNTFNNDSERWVLFKPHPEYVGHPIFFPVDPADEGQYLLMPLPSAAHDKPAHLREALFRFIVNVAYLNAVVNADGVEQNYSMLIHTSGIRADHSKDFKDVLKIFKVLTAPDPDNATWSRYFEALRKIASERYPEHIDSVLDYIAKNIGRKVVVVMNSPKDQAKVDFEPATIPSAPFTFAIGGNIVSRGVTFENLLSMFFTRDVKHRIQQDTYIQRARMFGSRRPYLKYFELSIPESLYDDWLRCFVYHTLALASIETGVGSPVWIEDNRIAAAAGAGIDRARINIDANEMGFDRFDYSDDLDAISNAHGNALDVLSRIQLAVGTLSLPDYLLSFVKSFSPDGNQSIAIHPVASMAGRAGADIDAITRTKGFIGNSELQKTRFPLAVHHIKIFHNGRGKARVFYKYTGNVRFLRMRQAS